MNKINKHTNTSQNNNENITKLQIASSEIMQKLKPV